MTHNGFYRDLFSFDLYQFCEHQAYVNACSNHPILSFSSSPVSYQQDYIEYPLTWSYLIEPLWKLLISTGAYTTFLAIIPWLRNSRVPHRISQRSLSTWNTLQVRVEAFQVAGVFLHNDGFWNSRWNTSRVKSYMEDRKSYIHVAYL